MAGLQRRAAACAVHKGDISKAGMTDDLNNLMLIELSEYKITREMACYVIRRAAEFTATGFVRNLGFL